MTEKKYKLSDNQVEILKSWFWQKPRFYNANEINSIRIMTCQGFANDAIMLTDDNDEIKLKLRLRDKIKFLTEFAIKNQINCVIEEVFHGGSTEQIYPEPNK